MSKYEWERGTITLPSKDWAKFRTDLIKAWNDKQGEVFSLAERAHKAALAAAKGKRGKGRQDAIQAAIARECGGKITEWGEFEATRRSSGWGSYEERDEAAYGKHEAVCGLILKREGWGRDATVTLQAPKKKDLDIHPTSKDCSLNLGEATVTFRNEGRTVTWSVSENNHACETAREHWFAKKLFAALGRITWTRGSGGQIVGNDEYNRDSDYAGGGGNYVTADYHPKTAAEKKAEARSRSYGGYGRNSYRW